MDMEEGRNETMSRIIHFVVLLEYLRRSQLLLTFIGHQVFYSVFCVVPSAEVTCKGLHVNLQA